MVNIQWLMAIFFSWDFGLEILGLGLSFLKIFDFKDRH